MPSRHRTVRRDGSSSSLGASQRVPLLSLGVTRLPPGKGYYTGDAEEPVLRRCSNALRRSDTCPFDQATCHSRHEAEGQRRCWSCQPSPAALRDFRGCIQPRTFCETPPLDVPLTQIDCTGWLPAELHTPAQPAQSMKRGEGSASSPPVERQDLPIRCGSFAHQLLHRLAAVTVVRDVVTVEH